MQAIVKQRARGYYDNHNKEVIQIMELKRKGARGAMRIHKHVSGNEIGP